MISGNSRRWLILFVAASLFVLSQFYRASVAVIAPDLIQDLGLNAWELSTVSASFFYAFALMQIPVGILLDSVGSRLAMTVLTLVSVAGAVIFSQGQSADWLTAGRLLLGVGMACNFMGTLKLLTVWFPRKQFATLSATVVSIGTAGNIVAATPLVLMVQAVGWRSSFLVMASVTLALAILFFLTVKDRPTRENVSINSPESLPKVGDTLNRARILMARPDFWIISFSTFCRYGIYAAVQALWAGPYLMMVICLSPVAAGNVLFLMNIGIVLGSPFCGHLSDFWIASRKKVVISGISGMAVLLFLFPQIPPGTSAWIMSGLFFLFGLFSSAGQIMYAHIKEQVPIENAGLAMTGINFFTMAGVAVFLQGLGSLMEWLYPEASLGSGAFNSAFLFCGVCLTLIAIAYTFTTETLGKSEGSRL